MKILGGYQSGLVDGRFRPRDKKCRYLTVKQQVGFLLLLLNIQSAFAEGVCAQMDNIQANFSEYYDCVEPVFWWIMIGGSSNTRKLTVSELIGERNANFASAYNNCIAKTPHSCQKWFLTLGGPNSVLSTIYNGQDTVISLPQTTTIHRIDSLGNVTLDIKNEYTGDAAAEILLICPTDFNAGEWKISAGNFLKFCVKSIKHVLVPTSQPHHCPTSKTDKVGDPCDPASGAETQFETDYRSPSRVSDLAFSRSYSSQSATQSLGNIGNNWRHNFSSSLRNAPVNNDIQKYGSTKYFTSTDACVQGFNELKNRIWGGELRNAIATRISRNVCRITNASGQAQAEFNIVQVPYSGPPGFVPQNTRYKTLTRGDGGVYIFKNTNGQWLSQTNQNIRLVQSGSQWIFTDGNNTRETYNATGQLLSTTTNSGRTTTLVYTVSIANGGDNNPLTLDIVTDALGNSLSFGYADNNGSPRVSTVTTPDGTMGYRYDANGNLEFVDNPDGTTKQYHYEDPNFTSALTGITDERGIRYATWAYNTAGKVILSEHAGGVERVNLAYNPDGTTTVTGSRGAINTYNFTLQRAGQKVAQITGDPCTNCPGGDRKARTYDSNGYLASYTDWGNATTRLSNYDAKGQYGCKVGGITAADASVGICAFDPAASPEARRTDYTYDPRFFNKITTITEPSVFTGSSKVTTRTYDTFGNRTSETISGFDPTGTPVARTTTWQYNGPLNQLSQIDGPRTDVADITSYRYHPNDTSAPIGARARLREVQDANSVLIRSNIQYTVTGKVLSEQRPNGLTLNYTYYPGNNRLQTLTETGGTSRRVTKWAYLTTGEVQSITTADGTPEATTLTFGYDNARRLTRITDGLGNYVEYTLDTESNRAFEKTYDSTGVLKKQLSQTFDLYNRLDTTARANETTNPTFALDGTLGTQTDGKGSITNYRYDALKRLTRVVQDQSSTGPTANTTTGYGYDVTDRLTTVTDPVSGNTTYVYDDLGNLLRQTSPDTGTTTFSYDAAGNLTNKTDALGQVFVYTYDALNRLTAINAPGTNDDITYRYDNCPKGSGRLCTVTYGTGTLPTGNQIHYQYTAFGDITQQQGLLYRYDAQGRIQTLDYPSGARLTYFYDAAGQVSQLDFSVNGQRATLASTLRYAPFGPLTRLTYGNGLSQSQTLDSAYRLTNQTTTGVLERSYPLYDANGNRLNQTDTLATNSTYTYDPLNRLKTGNGPFGARSYDYDLNGNRTQSVVDSGTTALTYAPNSNRLATLGATNVLLDANGNTLNQGNWTYTFNPHNRLQTATQATTLNASFAYNGLGQRIAKTNEITSTGTHVLYGQNGERRVETDETGNILVEYIYLNGQLLTLYLPDDDLDGIPNAQEAKQGTLPVNPDSDGDGLSNLTEWYQYGTDSANPDSDGDGTLDGAEIAAGTNPNQRTSFPGDGDINENGETNLGDLVLLYQFVLGNRVPTTVEFTHGDMNQDGTLNVADILLLQKQLLQVWLGVEGGTVLAEATRRRQQVQTPSALPVLDWLITPAWALTGNNGLLYYVHNDPLGTPQALTDEAGTAVWTAQYDPFGKATVNEDPDGDGTTIEFNVRFSGQYFDKETGLHYNYFRYYDPSTGRYLTSDPIGLDGGLNTYLYANANPLLFIDPDGLFGLLLNEFRRGGSRIPRQDALAINQFSNRLAEVSTIVAAAGPLAIAGSIEVGVAACRAIPEALPKAAEVCKKPILAFALGASICGNAAGTVKGSARRFSSDRELIDRITEASGRTLRRNTGSVSKP